MNTNAKISIIDRGVDELRPNSRNPRTHSKRQIEQIARSIEAFGFAVPIVTDRQGLVLAGHGRLKAARQLGYATVPTVCLDGLSEAEKRAYVLADNKIAENAGWDREILLSELGELIELLPVSGLDISITGFSAPEIDLLDADLGAADPADIVPPLQRSLVTRRGEVWLLGQHRLLCGDARVSEDLDRVCESDQADMVFADPPYNVRVAGHAGGRGRTRHGEFAFASGEMSEAEFRAFLDAFLRNAVRRSRAGAVHYVCMDWRHIDVLIGVAKPRYGAMLNLVVWTKTNAGQGSFYRSQHELIGVFPVEGAPHRNNVELGRHGRNRSNVWTYPGVNSFGAGRDEALASHPTVKPVALVADAMRDCTAKGDVVLDPFLGSGTTLLAAERLGRRCRAIEYEPAYVDLAIRRWQAATKLEAVLEGDGRTFAEVQAEREQAGPMPAVERGTETAGESPMPPRRNARKGDA